MSSPIGMLKVKPIQAKFFTDNDSKNSVDP